MLTFFGLSLLFNRNVLPADPGAEKSDLALTVHATFTVVRSLHFQLISSDFVAEKSSFAPICSTVKCCISVQSPYELPLFSTTKSADSL